MKIHLLSCAFLLTYLTSHGQKIEVSIKGGSNISHFTGSSSTANSYIIESYSSADKNAVNNPYGKHYAFGYNADIQLQFVTRHNLIAGLSAGYQSLNSKVYINKVQPAVYYFGPMPLIYFGPVFSDAEGSVSFHSSFINLSPYIGYRLNYKKVSLDILPGADIAFMQYNQGIGLAIAYDRVYTVNFESNKTPIDVRLKLGLTVNYHEFSVNGYFAHGLTNYDRNMIGDTPYKTYSQLFGLSLGCRID